MEGATHGCSSFSERFFHRETKTNEERAFRQGHRPQDVPLRQKSAYIEKTARHRAENRSISSRESCTAENSQYTDRSVPASEKSILDKKVQEQHEKPRRQKVGESFMLILNFSS